MTHNRRGSVTRNRLLRAAAKQFAAHGYRGTTVRGICREARANVAAVKYYFGSKENVYLAVFRHLFAEKGLRFLYDPPPLVSNATEWREALLDWALKLIDQVTGSGFEDRCRSRLFLWERSCPSAMFRVIRDEFFVPAQERLKRLLRLGLPADVSDETLQGWCVATLAQCTVYCSQDSRWDEVLIPGTLNRAVWLRRAAAQVAGSVTSRLTFRLQSTSS